MKVCVLGSGGLLGHMLIRVLSASHDVYGTTREKASKDSPLAQFLPVEKWIGEVDAAEPSSIKRVFEKNQFFYNFWIPRIDPCNTNIFNTIFVLHAHSKSQL